MRKEFDLKYFRTHRDVKIVTRKGDPVRVICVNRKDSQFPVVALISREDIEFPPYTFQENGHLLINEESSDDLFMEIEDYDFKPFDRMLVRKETSSPWLPAFALGQGNTDIEGYRWDFAIPYEGNEHLCFNT